MFIQDLERNNPPGFQDLCHHYWKACCKSYTTLLQSHFAFFFHSSLCTGCGWKCLTVAERAEKKLGESEVAQGEGLRVGVSPPLSPFPHLSSILFLPLSPHPILTRESVHYKLY